MARKLRLTLLSIALCLIGELTQCMAPRTRQSLLEEYLNADEIMLIIFEKALDHKNISEFLADSLKLVKNIRLVNKNFNRFTQALVQHVRRIAEEHFGKDFCIPENSTLKEELRKLIKEAKKDKKEQSMEKIAQLIMNYDISEIKVDYICSARHQIRIVILQFIARTNLFVGLIPLLVIYTVNLDLDKKDDAGDTALHSAVYVGNKEAIEMLCKCGARIDVLNKDKKTVIDWVEDKLSRNLNDKKNVKKIENYESIKKILLSYADSNIAIEPNNSDEMLKYELGI